MITSSAPAAAKLSPSTRSIATVSRTVAAAGARRALDGVRVLPRGALLAGGHTFDTHTASRSTSTRRFPLLRGARAPSATPTKIPKRTASESITTTRLGASAASFAIRAMSRSDISATIRRCFGARLITWRRASTDRWAGGPEARPPTSFFRFRMPERCFRNGV